MPESTTQSVSAIREDGPRLRLAVMGDSYTATFPIEGDVTLGRSPGVDFHIDHLSISRRHAVIRVGPPLAIEDLGSANGTRVAGVPLSPGARHPLSIGDVIELGELIAVVQGAGRARPRRMWVHGYFETRLEGECERASGSGSGLAVVRVSCKGSPEPAAVEAALFDAVRTADVVGYYAPNEFEVLLVDSSPDDARVFCRRVELELTNRHIDAGVGVATFPEHGRSADALLAHATALARGLDPGRALPVPGVVVVSAAMEQLYRQVDLVAPSDINVLLLGETGVGKEVVAEQIHKASPRADAPLVRVHCAAMPENLLESELFGHEKGAFTGATHTKTGLLESAAGGTVLLDEIGELPLSMQVKLLRVIEEHAVRRVGGLKTVDVDVRFIAATNRELHSEVARGAFRADLFYRLSGMTLVVPPLRERQDEIEPLVAQFASEASRAFGMPCAPRLSGKALALLRSYSWPGNVRELKNCIERAVLMAGGATIDVEHLAREKIAATTLPAPAPEPAGATPVRVLERAAVAEFSGEVTATQRIAIPERGLPASEDLAELMRRDREAVERKYILRALDQTEGHQGDAAALLGMSRRTLQYRLRTLGIAWKARGR
jgi:transcriptional regulator with GAF, ATPase, and Fis domain